MPILLGSLNHARSRIPPSILTAEHSKLERPYVSIRLFYAQQGCAGLYIGTSAGDRAYVHGAYTCAGSPPVNVFAK